MCGAVRGNCPVVSYSWKALVPWLWWLPTVSSCSRDTSSSLFWSIATFTISAYLPASVVLGCGSLLWLVLCKCRHVHGPTWLSDIASGIYRYRWTHYPRNCWDLKACGVGSIQPCAEMEEGCTEEKGLNSKAIRVWHRWEERMSFRGEDRGKCQPARLFSERQGSILDIIRL